MLLFGVFKIKAPVFLSKNKFVQDVRKHQGRKNEADEQKLIYVCWTALKVVYNNMTRIHLAWLRDALTDLENVKLIYCMCSSCVKSGWSVLWWRNAAHCCCCRTSLVIKLEPCFLFRRVTVCRKQRNVPVLDSALVSLFFACISATKRGAPYRVISTADFKVLCSPQSMQWLV